MPVPLADYFRRFVAARPAETAPTAPSKAARVAMRAEQRAAKARADAERARRKAEKAELRAAAQRAEAAAAARAFDLYLRVREWARGLCAHRDGSAAPEHAGEAPVSALAHLWDADRATIAQLRRWCEPITGVRAADYDTPSETLSRLMQRQAMALANHRGTELLVGESPMLGGFGVVRSGRLINEDTLRWFAASIALQDGGVLGQFRGNVRRQLVWDIGGGWGGFAYAFKTLCPNVTYLITGAPETLLVSAVYLMTVFPEARCSFFQPGADASWDRWMDADFVFAPEWALSSWRRPPIALTLDVMALRAMSAARVRAHVQHAYDSGSLYFYSMLPAPTAPDDARRVWDSIGGSYWLHPVPPRGITGVAFPPPAADEGFVHLVGWRRLEA
jgi:hypothetical protein